VHPLVASWLKPSGVTSESHGVKVWISPSEGDSSLLNIIVDLESESDSGPTVRVHVFKAGVGVLNFLTPVSESYKETTTPHSC